MLSRRRSILVVNRKILHSGLYPSGYQDDEWSVTATACVRSNERQRLRQSDCVLRGRSLRKTCTLQGVAMTMVRHYEGAPATAAVFLCTKREIASQARDDEWPVTAKERQRLRQSACMPLQPLHAQETMQEL